ncbi:hypothetical protein HK104_007958 [Borealophlyctis nickersoniae]|nr:hypothetical protein HK104_007958 [Borealophlyctis nickersoniae]
MVLDNAGVHFRAISEMHAWLEPIPQSSQATEAEGSATLSCNVEGAILTYPRQSEGGKLDELLMARDNAWLRFMDNVYELSDRMYDLCYEEGRRKGEVLDKLASSYSDVLHANNGASVAAELALTETSLKERMQSMLDHNVNHERSIDLADLQSIIDSTRHWYESNLLNTSHQDVAGRI